MNRLRGTALALLAAWAAALSLESWFRSPGVERPEPFPARIRVAGRTYHRLPAAAAARPLPADLVVLQAADYGAPGRPRLAVRWLTLPSSGRGIDFPLERVAPAVLGPGATGFCQLARRPGTSAPPLASKAALRHALEATAPRGWQRLAWLAGLRPYRSNACLWTGWRPQSASK